MKMNLEKTGGKLTRMALELRRKRKRQAQADRAASDKQFNRAVLPGMAASWAAQARKV